MKQLPGLIELARDISFDLNFKHARKWKTGDSGRIVVGCLPIYFPREIIHAANGLGIGILGGGDRIQIIKGDAYYQSYICHLPRSVMEMALNGNMDDFDGFIFPSICDCVRNLSGMFKLAKKGQFQRYFDYPQNFNPETGGKFYRQEMEKVINDMYKINKIKAGNDRLNNAIKLYNKNRQLTEKIYNIRQDFPWRLSAVDTYHIIRAGLMMPVEEHNKLLEKAIEFISAEQGDPMDNIRVVVTGAFCEQPPVGLIKSIEMAGCYIVDDDFLLGSRWIQGDIKEDTDDPLAAITDAYLNQSAFASCYYDVGNPKGERLVELVKKRKADGVIFAAASFCDPALLDRPDMQKWCDKAGVAHINFQYHENTGQFKVIKEQAGTFSDSIKLWEASPTPPKEGLKKSINN